MYCNPAAASYCTQYSISPTVLEFHKTLPGYAQTPLRALPGSFSARLGLKNVYMKDESLRFGLPAFKILGASWATFRALIQRLQLPADASMEEVRNAAAKVDILLHAATDGNFGRAVARMARLFGVAARIYVPYIMVEDTKALIREEGAQVEVFHGDYDATVRKAAQDAESSVEGLLIQDDAWPNYEEIPSWVVEGYSTMMTEIDTQIKDSDLDLVVCPVGVGSLAQATVSHFKALDRKRKVPRMLVVEPITASCLKTSLENGRSTVIETGATNMCGMNCGTVSSLAWPILREGVDGSTTVSETEAEQALSALVDMGLVTGPCSAGTLAALIQVSQRDNDRQALGLSERSTVVFLATEGPR